MRWITFLGGIVLLVLAGAYLWLITVGSCYDMGGWWRNDEMRCEYCVNGDGSRPAEPHEFCEEPPPAAPLAD